MSDGFGIAHGAVHEHGWRRKIIRIIRTIAEEGKRWYEVSSEGV